MTTTVRFTRTDAATGRSTKVSVDSIKTRNKPDAMSARDFKAAITEWPKALVSQNAKMARSNFYQWTIPALTASVVSGDALKVKNTCPGAGDCAAFCYAQQGGYRFKGSLVSHTRKLQAYLTDPNRWQRQMVAEIRALNAKGKLAAFRIHDSGDFFHVSYYNRWLNVVRLVPEVTFYAYTKMVLMVRQADLPDNLTIIYSYGGKWDNYIKPEVDRHSKVFSSLKELTDAGYVDTTETDMPASIAANRRVGLVYHGSKAYEGKAV